jgi:hypothetical protein
MTGGGNGLADRRIERKKLAGSCLKIANADEGESSKQMQMRERELYLVERLKEIGPTHKTIGLVFLGLFGDGLNWTQLKILKILFKINPNIFTFYITSIIFYYYLNKKIIIKQKISFFYTNFFYFFLHNNKIYYSISLLLRVQFIAKYRLSFFLIHRRRYGKYMS